jgi:CBS domain containing-hemolysin-like protein
VLGGILLAAVLILVNGFFVAAEFALVKVRATQLDLQVAEGSRSAKTARSILDRLDAYLSACQVGITLASLGLGWVGEPVVAAALAPLFHRLELSEELSHQIAVAVGFVSISVLHIVIGEQAPKNYAISQPLLVSTVVAWPLRGVFLVFYPALVVLNGASNLFLRALGIPVTSEHESAVPAEELRRIAEQSAAQGEITAGQGELLSNVFRFSGRVARDVMVPRAKVAAVDLAWPFPKLLEYVLENEQSRYPAYERDLDGIVGILHMKDLMKRMRGDAWSGEGLREILRPPLFVPETLSAQRLLQVFQRERSHLAVVLDEHGGVTGILTIEDALEELVGEIQDEHDVGERRPIEELEGGGWSMDGRVLLSELEELLQLPAFTSDSTTLSGFVMETLGRVARVDDKVALGRGYEGRVAVVSGRAIDRVEVTRPGSPTPAPPPSSPQAAT